MGRKLNHEQNLGASLKSLLKREGSKSTASLDGIDV
jgi:hypothetical protein